MASQRWGHPLATSGDFPWPPAGTSHGHHWGLSHGHGHDGGVFGIRFGSPVTLCPPANWSQRGGRRRRRSRTGHLAGAGIANPCSGLLAAGGGHRQPCWRTETGSGPGRGAPQTRRRGALCALGPPTEAFCKGAAAAGITTAVVARPVRRWSRHLRFGACAGRPATYCRHQKAAWSSRGVPPRTETPRSSGSGTRLRFGRVRVFDRSILARLAQENGVGPCGGLAAGAVVGQKGPLGASSARDPGHSRRRSNTDPYHRSKVDPAALGSTTVIGCR